jgi:hypothetical protein
VLDERRRREKMGGNERKESQSEVLRGRYHSALLFIAPLLSPNTLLLDQTPSYSLPFHNMPGNTSGETFQERSKGKDVRTSNIVAAKVRNVMRSYIVS